MLKFFSLSPFDEVRYRALLEGLNISEVMRSKLNNETRVDAEYFKKENLLLNECLKKYNLLSIGEFAYVTDGIHTAIDYCEKSSVNLISATSPKENIFDLSRQVFISEEAHSKNPRTALKKGDVILSTVGTIGNCAVVDESVLPANSDRHVGIIRLEKSFSPYFLSTFLLSKYGKFQTLRESTGNVQLNLFLYKIRELVVPCLNDDFQEAIETLVKNAHAKLEQSKSTYTQAETLLLDTLGLADFSPSTKKVNIKSFKDSFLATGRLDAEYYQPKYEHLLLLLKKDGLTIGDVAPARHIRFDKTLTNNFNYIEIGGLNADGTASSEILPYVEAPSRATQLVVKGDVITSTVRPIRRLSALIQSKQDGYVCSSGFVVLNPTHIAAEVLLVYLRSPIFCELMDLFTSASLYPAISEKDLLSLPIPNIAVDIQANISEKIQQSFTLKARSEHLLNVAKRAVEIAIETNEQTALNYINEHTGAKT